MDTEGQMHQEKARHEYDLLWTSLFLHLLLANTVLRMRLVLFSLKMQRNFHFYLLTFSSHFHSVFLCLRFSLSLSSVHLSKSFSLSDQLLQTFHLVASRWFSAFKTGSPGSKPCCGRRGREGFDAEHKQFIQKP